MTQHSFHPFANAFPMLPPDELATLAKSIQQSGLREPIVLHRDGSILDGRNRYLACRVSQVEPRFTIYEGTDQDALAWVTDTNLHRRHLSESQRALVAARLATFTHGGARAQAAHVPDEITQAEAAQRLGVSERSVRDGRVVLDHGPEEVAAAVEEGILAVRAAAELIRAAGKDRVLAAEFYRLRRSSRNDEWRTPRHIIDLAVQVMGAIDLDPASNDGDPWVPAARHFTRSDDGLNQSWLGRVFLNPPWSSSSSPRPWVEKLLTEFDSDRVTEAVVVLPARVNTDWFALLAPHPRCFVRGRLQFSESAGSAPFATTIVYLGGDSALFSRKFRALGDVYGLLKRRVGPTS